MSIINVLDKQVANLIAAGEVVDRPASIVKELVENSIDAAATMITVEIKAGGTQYIRVTDNGIGMSPQDARLCFARHATSKVKTKEDLVSIGTLGFRGEALAATAAVSKVTLKTREASSLEGTEVILEGGIGTDFGPCGCPVGTTIIVADLFYNTPARKKFLKKETTEAANIGAVVEKMVMANSTVAFEYIKDGKTSLLTSGGDLRTAARAVMGSLADSMLKIEGTAGEMGITGLVSPPEATRPNRGGQHFFVCGRYIRSRTLQIALEEAVSGRIPSGRYPSCVLAIDLPAHQVDANVHPQKLEVRFADERSVFDLVSKTVRSVFDTRSVPPGLRLASQQQGLDPSGSSLGRGFVPSMDSVQQGFEQEAKGSLQNYGTVISDVAQIFAPKDEGKTRTPVDFAAPSNKHAGKIDIDASDWVYVPPKKQADAEGGAQSNEEKEQKDIEKDLKISGAFAPVSLTDNLQPQDGEGQSELIYSPQSGEGQISHNTTAQKPLINSPDDNADEQNELAMPPSFRVAGELFRTYFIVEFEDEIWLVDKHAAHERILYEQLLTSENAMAQRLMEPKLCVLGRTDAQAAIEGTELLLACGLEIEAFGDDAVLVRSMPMGLDAALCADLITELCGLIRDGRREITSELTTRMLHKIACVAAVKGGDKEVALAGEALIKELVMSPQLRSCPHGRPCVKRVPKSYFDKEFYRT